MKPTQFSSGDRIIIRGRVCTIHSKHKSITDDNKTVVWIVNPQNPDRPISVGPLPNTEDFPKA